MGEVCDTTIAFLKNPEVRISETLLAPDFPTGGEVLYDPRAIEDIYNTGRGGVKVRARWRYDKKENLIEIYEIPYTTTTEAIMDKVAELIKAGKVKEISDMRDETDLSGLKLTIDLKRGADPDKLMQKLFKATTLQDTASCNFNVLIGGMPRVMGVRELLDEWCAWRTESVKRRVYFVLKKRQDKLHLLKGLKKILLDIDKAIKIIRETEKEADVVPNLMIGFGIDQIQAEYVAEIKLRNINREYILKRVEETASLEAEIEDLEDTLARPSRIRKIIVSELEDVRKKYAEPRRTGILYDYAEDAESEEDAIEDYPVTLFLSQHGYFKKITPQSLRMSGEQKFKEDDALSMSVESSNAAELMFFTDRQQVYKVRAADFADGKASLLGDYLPTKLGMDEDEKVMFLSDMGLEKSGLDRLIKKSYSLLGLISYLTAGKPEVRAWTIKKGTKAPQAAGKIHSDFERGFIRAEVVPYQTLLECGNYTNANERGKVRSEGKDYEIKDGDVVLFRFNV